MTHVDSNQYVSKKYTYYIHRNEKSCFLTATIGFHMGMEVDFNSGYINYYCDGFQLTSYKIEFLESGKVYGAVASSSHSSKAKFTIIKFGKCPDYINR